LICIYGLFYLKHQTDSNRDLCNKTEKCG